MKLAVPHLPVTRFELASGARLLVSPRTNAPVCAIQVHVRGGHSLDEHGLEGLASLVGRLADQGTARYDEETIATRLEGRGGSLNGASTGLQGAIAGDSWKLLVELLCECLTSPTYPKLKFERERRRVLDRLRIEKDDPRIQAGQRFRELVYGKHWLGRSESGRFESVRRIARGDVAGHHRRNWVAARSVIAVSGDVDPQAVRRELDRRLKGWKRGQELAPASVDFPPLRRRVAAHPADRQQVHVYLGHLGIRRSHPDFAALVVMDHVLGTGPGFTNRIARILRDELGLAYAVNAAISSSAGAFPGMFAAYIGTSPENVRTAVEGFVREIERIRSEPIRADELELAKSYLTGSFALGYERAARRVNAIVSAHRCGLPDDHLTRLLEEIQAVTVDDVQRVAAAHLHPREACVVAAGPITARELDAIVAGTRPRTRRRAR